jgi:adenine-specific DNA-methyltransferase
MTELIWDGKYDDKGNKTAPLRVSLPFQTVETVNETAQERQLALDLFATGRDSAWRNRLIWGDKKFVLPSLIDEFAGRVNLIYIDPPFNVGADFSYTTEIPLDIGNESGGTFTKEPSIIEQKAYRDTWGRGLDSYLQWFYETLVVLRELLSDDGSLYVHLDGHIGHYAKTVLDEVFGTTCFINSIVWKRSDAHSDVGQGAKHLGKVCDFIFFYSRTPDGHKLNMQYLPLPDSTVERWYRHTEPDTGRRYNKADITGPGGAKKGNPVFSWHGVTRAWRFGKERMQELDQQGRITYSSTGMAYLKRYLDESKGIPLQDLWDDIRMIRGIHTNSEGLGYPTQKPESLLQRIVGTSSDENDLVLDCFCGSGTTAAVAEKMNRRWIACDLGRFAIHTTRKRLLSIPNVRPFVVQNLGKYERQAWQVTEFAEKPENARHQAAVHQAYLRFMLGLYKAQPITGYNWLHGLKNGRMVHVGAVDSPISLGDITQIIAEFKKAIGTATTGERGELAEARPTANAVDVLGWDFAFELNEVARQQAQAAKVNLRFQRIPRDVMDKRAVEQGDIHFFELAALSVEVQQKKRDVAVTLTDFVIPPDDVPEDVQRAIKHWSQWIDYWAVDWDYRDDTFHNQWQTYRTRQSPDLDRSAAHTYAGPGSYTIVVKVIDLLGNDTTKALSVKVK